MDTPIGLLYVRSSASNRSASAATICARASDASSSVSVRSGDWNERWIATDFRPGADLLASIDVEDARLAEETARYVVGGVHERTDLDLLAHRHSDVLEHRRERDHVLVRNRVACRQGKDLDVKLERTPGSFQQRGV